MNKGTFLTTVFLLMSAPALAQVGGVDRTLGNGNVPSAAPWIQDLVTTSLLRVVRSPDAGGVDGTFGNGNVPSAAPWLRDDVPASPVWRGPGLGGVDGTLGNGNVESQAPWIR